jgi:hypothetical protein
MFIAGCEAARPALPGVRRLACASLSLVMLVLTGALYSQHHKPRAAPVLSRAWIMDGASMMTTLKR